MSRVSKKARPVLLVLALVVMFFLADLSLAMAGSSLRIVGFSKSGKFLAVSRWFPSGSERLVVKVRILNAAKNSFVSRSVSRSVKAPPPEDMSTAGMMLQDLEMKTVEKADSLMERFGIEYDSGVYLSGKYEGYKPELSIIGNSKNWSKISFEGEIDGEYFLKLDTRGSPGGRGCAGGKPTRIFTLTLIGENGKRKILQKDKKLYRSRKCPFNYEILRVVLHENSIVVIVQSTIPGEMGAESRDLIVTGTLN